MSREQLVQMARRSIEHHLGGTTDRVEHVTRMPVGTYFDPQRWQREVQQIFRRVPLLLALGAELGEPHSYKAMEVAGMPVLITRGSDGAVRAFVNMCSHRGAMLVDEGSGTARRFTCPYHAWTYDQHGDLVGVFKQADFGELDTSCLGLTSLPIAERAGLIWVILSPQAHVDIDTFLCGYDELLEHHRFADMHHYGRRVLTGPNWKVAFDGYVDFYHLPILHKNTFGSDISPDAVFHHVGPHQRITGPRQRWDKLLDIPEDEWPIKDLIGGVWSIFPHGSIAGFDVGEHKLYQIARLFPGATPEESVSHLDYVSLGEPTDEFCRLVEKQIDFLVGVVRDEDYATGLKIQRTVKTGAKQELVFGRNEGGAQYVHGWIQRVLDAADGELEQLFRGAR
jgi:nitrite reductase/ring-hydroxylating ferredoxin subunit